MERKTEERFSDFIVFIDDDESKVERFCTVLAVTESWVRFALKSGRVIIIPWTRVIKIKEHPTGGGRL